MVRHIYLDIVVIDLIPGMVLAEEVTAKDDLPPFRASVMVIYIFLLCILRMATQSNLKLPNQGLY